MTYNLADKQQLIEDLYSPEFEAALVQALEAAPEDNFLVQFARKQAEESALNADALMKLAEKTAEENASATPPVSLLADSIIHFIALHAEELLQTPPTLHLNAGEIRTLLELTPNKPLTAQKIQNASRHQRGTLRAAVASGALLTAGALAFNEARVATNRVEDELASPMAYVETPQGKKMPFFEPLNKLPEQLGSAQNYQVAGLLVALTGLMGVALTMDRKNGKGTYPNTDDGRMKEITYSMARAIPDYAGAASKILIDADKIFKTVRDSHQSAVVR